jgi:hypothetical protein
MMIALSLADQPAPKSYGASAQCMVRRDFASEKEKRSVGLRSDGVTPPVSGFIER